MMIPVRCFTCGKPIGGVYEIFQKRVKAGEKPKDVLDDLKVERYCCRRMLISHLELIDDSIMMG